MLRHYLNIGQPVAEKVGGARRKRARAMASLLALVVALVTVPSGQATDGRDFAGFYEVSNVTDLGDTVRLTLTVRIFNYSDESISAATVSLQDSLTAGNDYGSYPGTVAIADRESVRLTEEFTISRDEHNRWQNGARPALRIHHSNSAGNAVKPAIEMQPGIVGEE